MATKKELLKVLKNILKEIAPIANTAPRTDSFDDYTLMFETKFGHLVIKMGDISYGSISIWGRFVTDDKELLIAAHEYLGSNQYSGKWNNYVSSEVLGTIFISAIEQLVEENNK